MGSWDDNGGASGIPSNPAMGPRVISHTMTEVTYQYLMRMLDLGAVEGALGEMGLAPDLKPVIEALHMVLAGGEVKIEVTHRGNPDIFNELNRRLAIAQATNNELNKKVGFYLTEA